VVNFGLANVAHNGQSALAAVVAEHVYLLPLLLPDSSPDTFDDAFPHWDLLIDAISAALDKPRATPVLVGEVEFLPPATTSPAIWCAGANYSDHVSEMGASIDDVRPFHFLSPPTVLNSHLGTVHRPTGSAQVDWEIELAVIIGRTARRVSADNALSHVAGYAVANDISVRDRDWLQHPFFGVDWTATKNADGLTPIGPVLIPAKFVSDPANLNLKLSVNGLLRQDSNTSRMIIDVPTQIASLSNLVTLRPGDIILTGTPAGTAAAHQNAYLGSGDVVLATIEGLGTLENRID